MARKILIIGVIMFLSACTGQKVENYKDTEPKMDIKEYFNGPIKAWGIVQDWKGKVVSRFDVDMVGSWEGDKGKLEEEFRYYNGEAQHRTWNITKVSEDRYIGKASDIIGEARGEEKGSAVNWGYEMDLEVDGSTYRIKFDDWMWLMNDGVLINRSYLKKFGFTVAELTLFMQKQDQDNQTQDEDINKEE